MDYPLRDEPYKFSNIRDEEGWEKVGMEEQKGNIVYEEGKGSYSRPSIVSRAKKEKPAESLVEAVQADWNKRESFEKQVFKQIGGNPFKMTSDTEISRFGTEGGYEDMFNYVFQGELSWRNRRRMTPEQKDFWNKTVLSQHAKIENDTAKKRQNLKVEYDYMMGKFDKRATAVGSARETIAKAETKRQKEYTKALEKRIKEDKTLKKEERKAATTSLRKLADNTKGYSESDMTFWSKPNQKGKQQPIDKTPLEIQEMNLDARKIGEPGFATIEKDGVSYYPRIPHISDTTTADDIRRTGAKFAQQNPDLWPEYKEKLFDSITESVAMGFITREKADEILGKKGPTAEEASTAAPEPEKLAEQVESPEVAKAEVGIDKQIKEELATLPETSKVNINKMFAAKIRKAKSRQEKMKVKREMLKKIKFAKTQPGTPEEEKAAVPYKSTVFADI